MSRISKSDQTVKRIKTRILESDPEDFFKYADDLWQFHIFVLKKNPLFKINKYFRGVFDEICFTRPSLVHKKLVKALTDELNCERSILEVFRIVLCLEYLGYDLDLLYTKKENHFKIICIRSLIKLLAYQNDWHLAKSNFMKLYNALLCIEQ